MRRTVRTIAVLLVPAVMYLLSVTPASAETASKINTTDSSRSSIEAIAQFLDSNRTTAPNSLVVHGKVAESAGFWGEHDGTPLPASDTEFDYSAKLVVDPANDTFLSQSDGHLWHVDLKKYVHVKQALVFDHGVYRLHQQIVNEKSELVEKPIDVELDSIEHQGMVNDFRLWPAYLSNGFLPVVSDLGDAMRVDGDFFRQHAKMPNQSEDRVIIGRVTVDGLYALSQAQNGRVAIVVCSDQLHKVAMTLDVVDGEIHSWQADFESLPGLHQIATLSLEKSATSLSPSGLLASLPPATNYYLTPKSSDFELSASSVLYAAVLGVVFCLVAFLGGQLSIPRVVRARVAVTAALVVALLAGVQFAAASCTSPACETSRHFGFRSAVTCMPLGGFVQFSMSVTTAWSAKGGSSTLTNLIGSNTSISGLGITTYNGTVCSAYLPGPCDMVVNTPEVFSGTPFMQNQNSCR